MTGCGAQASHTPAAPNTKPSELAPNDSRACAGVEAVIGHITVDTARWSPRRHPFDIDIATRLSTETKNLAAQATVSDGPEIRAAVMSMASAFDGVATAMRSRQRARVARAIERSRVAYRTLKQACRLSDR